LIACFEGLIESSFSPRKASDLLDGPLVVTKFEITPPVLIKLGQHSTLGILFFVF